MATRIYAVGPAGTVENVQENVGPTATSAIIAVVVDLAASVTGAAGVARTVSRAETLQALQAIMQRILNDSQWPPA